MNTYTILVNTQNKNCNVHAVDCSVVQRPRRDFVTVAVEAETPQVAADTFTKGEQLVERGWRRAKVCRCCYE